MVKHIKCTGCGNSHRTQAARASCLKANQKIISTGKRRREPLFQNDEGMLKGNSLENIINIDQSSNSMNQMDIQPQAPLEDQNIIEIQESEKLPQIQQFPARLFNEPNPLNLIINQGQIPKIVIQTKWKPLKGEELENKRKQCNQYLQQLERDLQVIYPSPVEIPAQIDLPDGLQNVRVVFPQRIISVQHFFQLQSKRNNQESLKEQKDESTQADISVYQQKLRVRLDKLVVTENAITRNRNFARLSKRLQKIKQNGFQRLVQKRHQIEKQYDSKFRKKGAKYYRNKFALLDQKKAKIGTALQQKVVQLAKRQLGSQEYQKAEARIMKQIDQFLNISPQKRNSKISTEYYIVQQALQAIDIEKVMKQQSNEGVNNIYLQLKKAFCDIVIRRQLPFQKRKLHLILLRQNGQGLIKFFERKFQQRFRENVPIRFERLWRCQLYAIHPCPTSVKRDRVFYPQIYKEVISFISLCKKQWAQSTQRCQKEYEEKKKASQERIREDIKRIFNCQDRNQIQKILYLSMKHGMQFDAPLMQWFAGKKIIRTMNDLQELLNQFATHLQQPDQANKTKKMGVMKKIDLFSHKPYTFNIRLLPQNVQSTNDTGKQFIYYGQSVRRDLSKYLVSYMEKRASIHSIAFKIERNEYSKLYNKIPDQRSDKIKQYIDLQVQTQYSDEERIMFIKQIQRKYSEINNAVLDIAAKILSTKQFLNQRSNKYIPLPQFIRAFFRVNDTETLPYNAVQIEQLIKLFCKEFQYFQNTDRVNVSDTKSLNKFTKSFNKLFEIQQQQKESQQAVVKNEGEQFKFTVGALDRHLHTRFLKRTMLSTFQITSQLQKIGVKFWSRPQQQFWPNKLGFFQSTPVQNEIGHFGLVIFGKKKIYSFDGLDYLHGGMMVHSKMWQKQTDKHSCGYRALYWALTINNYGIQKWIQQIQESPAEVDKLERQIQPPKSLKIKQTSQAWLAYPSYPVSISDLQERRIKELNQFQLNKKILKQRLNCTYTSTNRYPENFTHKIIGNANPKFPMLNKLDQTVLLAFKHQILFPPIKIMKQSEIKGYGAFAARQIKKNELIDTYSGTIMNHEFLQNNAIPQQYIMALIEGTSQATTWSICPIKYSSFGPLLNCATQKKDVNVISLMCVTSDQFYILLKAKRRIKEGQQLLYEYNGRLRQYDTSGFIAQ